MTPKEGPELQTELLIHISKSVLEVSSLAGTRPIQKPNRCSLLLFIQEEAQLKYFALQQVYLTTAAQKAAFVD